MTELEAGPFVCQFVYGFLKLLQEILVLLQLRAVLLEYRKFLGFFWFNSFAHFSYRASHQ